MHIRIITPTLAHEAALLAYQQALAAADIPVHGAYFDLFPDIPSWLAACAAPAGTRLPNGIIKVADSNWIAWDDDSARVVGVINLRHTLNDYLRAYGGHIGYGVHPACWNQGIATRMLTHALQYSDSLGLRELLLVCAVDNPASARVIEKNGGERLDTVDHEGELLYRYRIRRNDI